MEKQKTETLQIVTWNQNIRNTTMFCDSNHDNIWKFSELLVQFLFNFQTVFMAQYFLTNVFL